ncbi:WXG100 family type VII secretion target [Streptomyces sp. NPDC059637]|uniref:WXG100 family type VII secretion target n=1 Tax=Streptomyces sp. NPDC059637 TaxID=3347752 RepID=UPI003680818A
MAGGPGYSIQSEGSGKQAGVLDKAADDVGDAKKAVEDGVCYAPATFGGPDSGAAYNAFSAAWQAEAQTIKDALREQADKIRVSTANYDAADKGVISSMNAAAGAGAGAFGAAGFGGGGATGTPGVSTQPAYTERPAALGEPPLSTHPTPGERPHVVGDPPVGTRPTLNDGPSPFG